MAKAGLAEHGLKVDYLTMWEFVQAESSVTKKTLIASRCRPSAGARPSFQILYFFTRTAAA